MYINLYLGGKIEGSRVNQRLSESWVFCSTQYIDISVKYIYKKKGKQNLRLWYINAVEPRETFK